MVVIFSKHVGDKRLLISNRRPLFIDSYLLLRLLLNNPVELLEHCLDLRHVISESIMDCSSCGFFAGEGYRERYWGR